MNDPFLNSNNGFQNEENNLKSSPQEDVQISPQNKQQMQKLFLILIGVGLVIGIFSAWGIVTIMSQFGLTEKTNQIEQLRN